jgi:energy-converting hydrogenase A subunit M
MYNIKNLNRKDVIKASLEYIKNNEEEVFDILVKNVSTNSAYGTRVVYDERCEEVGVSEGLPCEHEIGICSFDTDDEVEKEWVRSEMEDLSENLITLPDDQDLKGVFGDIIERGIESLVESGEESTNYRLVREKVVEDQKVQWIGQYLSDLIQELEEEIAE